MSCGFHRAQSPGVLHNDYTGVILSRRGLCLQPRNVLTEGFPETLMNCGGQNETVLGKNPPMTRLTSDFNQ